MDQMTVQAVVTPQSELKSDQGHLKLALFNPNGSLFGLSATPIVIGTAIGTAAKTTTSDEPEDNSFVLLKFTNGNSAASPTVAFNGGSARAVLLGGTAPSGAESTFAANGVGLYWFDGTNLHQIGLYS